MEEAVRLPAEPRWDERADVDLIRAARVDVAAYGELYRRHLTSVYRYLAARVGPDEASDLTQLVFVRAWEALPRYRERGAPFAAWLFRIARNAAADARRRTGRLAPLEGIPPMAADPADDLIRREALAHLRAALAELEPDRRELLALRFAGGLTSREIAAALGQSEASVKKRITRTIQMLKERCGE